MRRCPIVVILLILPHLISAQSPGGRKHDQDSIHIKRRCSFSLRKLMVGVTIASAAMGALHYMVKEEPMPIEEALRKAEEDLGPKEEETRKRLKGMTQNERDAEILRLATLYHGNLAYQLQGERGGWNNRALRVLLPYASPKIQREIFFQGIGADPYRGGELSWDRAIQDAANLSSQAEKNCKAFATEVSQYYAKILLTEDPQAAHWAAHVEGLVAVPLDLWMPEGKQAFKSVAQPILLGNADEPAESLRGIQPATIAYACAAVTSPEQELARQLVHGRLKDLNKDPQETDEYWTDFKAMRLFLGLPAPNHEKFLKELRGIQP